MNVSGVLRRNWGLLPVALRQRVRTGLKFVFNTVLLPLRVIAALPWIVLRLAALPFVKITFAHMGRVNSFGVLAVGPDAYFREWQVNGKPKDLKLYFLIYDAANIPLLEMYKRHIDVIDNKFVNLWAVFIAPVMKALGIFIYDHLTYLARDRYTKTLPTLTFSPEEEKRGLVELAKMGVGENDWFVCFHNRDNAFFHNAYHEYRNSSVENLIPAMEEVTRRGGYAIRLGAEVEHPLPETGNSKIIDYATQFRSPFMDIYLCAKNKFMFGTTSGVVTLPIVFNKPAVIANNIPLCALPMRFIDPYIPKLVRRKGGDFVSFSELYKLGFFDIHMDTVEIVEAMKANGLEAVENSAEDLLDVCLDMFDILEGNPLPEGARALQLCHRDRFFPSLEENVELLISPRFILRHKDIICS